MDDNGFSLKTNTMRTINRLSQLTLFSSRLILAMAVSVQFGPASTVIGKLSGTVVDDTGKNVGGARVTISFAAATSVAVVPGPPVVTGPLATSVPADEKGVFQIDSLRAGRYVVCVTPISQGLLDSCKWSKTGTEVMVSGGQTLTGIKIVLLRGAVLAIHLDDPGKLLKAANGQIDWSCQIHAITDRGIHHNIQIQNTTGSGRDHAITVPFETKLAIRAFAKDVSVTDPVGALLQSHGTMFSIPAGSTPTTITFQVSAKK